MSKIHIVYATKTKHSKKIAHAIGERLKVKPDNVLDKPLYEDVNLLYIIGGIYGGESLPELIDFVKNLDSKKVKKVALITSCASKVQGQKTIRTILEDKNIPVIDEHLCRGSFLIYKMGHPNKHDIQEAAEFAYKLS